MSEECSGVNKGQVRLGLGLRPKTHGSLENKKRTVDLAVSSASSLKRGEGAESVRRSLKRSLIVDVEGVSLFIVYSQGA